MLSVISKDISLISGYYETMLSLNDLYVGVNTLVFNVQTNIRISLKNLHETDSWFRLYDFECFPHFCT